MNPYSVCMVILNPNKLNYWISLDSIVKTHQLVTPNPFCYWNMTTPEYKLFTPYSSKKMHSFVGSGEYHNLYSIFDNYNNLLRTT